MKTTEGGAEWVEGTHLGWALEWRRRSWVGRVLYFGAVPCLVLAVPLIWLGDRLLFTADRWDGIPVCARFE